LFDRRKFVRGFVRLVKHSLIGMPVSTVIAALTAGPVVLVLKAIGLTRNIGAWYHPVNWLAGLVLGFFVNRRYLHVAACLVWIPGALWLAYGIRDAQPQGIRWEAVKHALFPLRPDECGMTECLYVLFYTFPALNAAAYSLGAWIGILSGKGRSAAVTVVNR
jgi:hypothetical protein